MDTAGGIVRTRGRGLFRKRSLTPVVGDYVEIEIQDDGDGIIRRILDRRNCFKRPPVSNLDCILTVFSPVEPKPDFRLIDKLLIMAQSNNVIPALCMNKSDLVTNDTAENILSPYRICYDVFKISTFTGEGMDQLKKYISGMNTAIAGASGVGKSSITNLLAPDANMETSKISRKTNRGIHTTRHVELFKLTGGGYLYDTPGFTSFDLSGIAPEELAGFYPEIARKGIECKFDDCSHTHEPGCAVTEAMRAGEIGSLRYESYVKNYRELLERSKWKNG